MFRSKAYRDVFTAGPEGRPEGCTLALNERAEQHTFSCSRPLACRTLVLEAAGRLSWQCDSEEGFVRWLINLKTARYEVVWPCGERRLKQRPLAKRLDTLNGKTVAQLWDYLFAGDEVFTALEEKLRATVSRREMGQLARVRLDPRRQREGIARLAAAALQRTGSRRRHLIDGLLRQLHARRVAGQ